MQRLQVPVGNIARLETEPGREFSYLDDAGIRVAADPTAAAGWYRKPNDTIDRSAGTVYTTGTTGGRYIEVKITELGVWKLRIVATGIGPHAIDAAIEVEVEGLETEFTHV